MDTVIMAGVATATGAVGADIPASVDETMLKAEERRAQVRVRIGRRLALGTLVYWPFRLPDGSWPVRHRRGRNETCDKATVIVNGGYLRVPPEFVELP